MSGFVFRGVRQAPNGDMVPDLSIEQSAYNRIRARWSAMHLLDHAGQPVSGYQKESLIEELVGDDALWQFWLSNDLKGGHGELTWQEMPEVEKLGILVYCVTDGKWWREWAETNLEYDRWPWQKRLAFERTAVRESINTESPIPATLKTDSGRRELAAKMVDWHLAFDSENIGLSPYHIPSAYIGLTFETI